MIYASKLLTVKKKFCPNMPEGRLNYFLSSFMEYYYKIKTSYSQLHNLRLYKTWIFLHIERSRPPCALVQWQMVICTGLVITETWIIQRYLVVKIYYTLETRFSDVTKYILKKNYIWANSPVFYTPLFFLIGLATFSHIMFLIPNNLCKYFG